MVANTVMNLCPHSVTVKSNDGEVTVLEETGLYARVDFVQEGTLMREYNEVGKVVTSVEEPETTLYGEGIPIKLLPLPHYREGRYYLVSRIVQLANPNRIDLLVPNTVDYDLTKDGKKKAKSEITTAFRVVRK